jgi:hypothetical protein
LEDEPALAFQILSLSLFRQWKTTFIQMFGGTNAESGTAAAFFDKKWGTNAVYARIRRYFSY